MSLEGKHKAKPVGASLGFTKDNKEQVGIVLEIIEGDATGQTITRYGSFSDAALPYTLKDLRTCGWVGDDLSDLSSVGGDGGVAVEIVIGQEEYPAGSGQWHDKVKFINALGAGGAGLAKPLDATQAKAFAARMRNNVRALEAANGTLAKPAPKPAPKPKPASQPPPHDDRDAPAPPDDEIPF